MDFVLRHLAVFVSVPTILIIAALLIFIPGAWVAVLALLRTTFGRVVAILTIALLLSNFGTWEFRGYVEARSAERARLAAEAAMGSAILKQTIVNNEIEDKANRRAEEADTKRRIAEGKLDEFVSDLSQRKDARCLLTERDVRGLRGLGGSKADPAQPSRQFRRPGA